MTSTLKILMVAGLLVMSSAFAQENFLRICEKPEKSLVNEMNWLKIFFKVKDCQGVADNIKKLQSYNEFFVPFQKRKPTFANSWTNAFPHLYGITSKIQSSNIRPAQVGIPFNVSTFFDRPEIYSEFKNLTVIDFYFRSFSLEMCEILKQLPHIKTVMLGLSDTDDLARCKGIKIPDIILIDTGIIPSMPPELEEKVIGVEYLAVMTNFERYPRLRYLGVSSAIRDSDLRNFIVNQNITHLNINSTSNLNLISNLGDLANLSFLSISCIKNLSKAYLNDSFVPEKCEDSKLKDISFLKNLPFLEDLTINYTDLEEASPLAEMTQLKRLNLSHNKIKNMPELSHLELEHSEISENDEDKE